MANVTVSLTPEDVHRIVGMLAAGADPLSDPTPKLATAYDALGSALVQAIALRVRGPQIEAELANARAALAPAERAAGAGQ